MATCNVIFIMRNIITTLLIIVFLSGCENTLKNKIIGKVDHECGNNSKLSCVIILKDITKFKWDKMYLFGSWTTSDSIRKVIGFNYEGDDAQDDYKRMLFTYGYNVVYEENFRSFDYHSSTINFPG
jgi:hypothetical protein